jgi:2-oxoglutarate ferredoxin oxidoreductase subunit alpha
VESQDFKSNLDFVIRFGGEGGEGVISAGELFAQAASRTEYHVFTYITYPAEIRGGFSSIQVRVRDWTIYSMGSKVDYLISFNQDAIDRTFKYVKKDGCLIYDPDHVAPPRNECLTYYPIPISSMSKNTIGTHLGKNIVVLGALGYLFDIKKSVLEKLISDRFRMKGDRVITLNFKALEAGYQYAAEQKWTQKFFLREKSENKSRYVFLSGNEAIALGAITAGCRFVAGYPITPATPIFETLIKLMPKVGGVAIQMEDEIASISALVGASYAGEKVMTPTSGPGLQLMGEQLNLACMLELPIVIVNVQRGGPSTGMPTKTEQSDLKFAIYGTSGEAPRIILAPTSVEDSYYQTIRAFNLAERFQMPVILLTDQSIGYRKATVQIPEITRLHDMAGTVPVEDLCVPNTRRINILHRAVPDESDLKRYKRFRITDDGISPVSRPGTPKGQYLATGLEHTEEGFPDYSPANHLKMTRKRFRKLEVLSQRYEMNPPEYYGSSEAIIGIIGWGSTEGAIREAVYMARDKGIPVKHLHTKEISPLPERHIRQFLCGLKQVMVVEENFTGQFSHFIKAKFGIKPVEVHKCEGIPFHPEEIFTAIKKIARIVDEKNITKL